MYKGPWKIPANKRTPKDPTAPKRPMSAFLAFSNKRRAALKRQHPDATNADLSKMLSKTWKEAPDELRRKYMEEEAGLREMYKVEMAKWRKKVAEEKKAERKEREAMAMQAAEARSTDFSADGPHGTNSQAMQNGMQPGQSPGHPPQQGQGGHPGMSGSMQPGMQGMSGAMQPGMQNPMAQGMQPGMQGGMYGANPYMAGARTAHASHEQPADSPTTPGKSECPTSSNGFLWWPELSCCSRLPWTSHAGSNDGCTHGRKLSGS
jgi:hypothetical protein